MSAASREREILEQLRKDLPGSCILVVSKDDFRTNTYGGQVSEVPLDVAAKLFARESHRPATNREISEHKEADRAAKQTIENQRLKDKVGTVMYLTPDGALYTPAPQEPQANAGKPGKKKDDPDDGKT